MYFIIFKKKKDKDYRLFTNTVFSEEKNAKEFGRKVWNELKNIK